MKELSKNYSTKLPHPSILLKAFPTMLSLKARLE